MKCKTVGMVLGMVVMVCHTMVRADDLAAAEALFKAALAKFKEGNFAEACPAFAESQRLDPRPGTLFAMAECEVEADHIATAATLYEDFLRTVAGIKNPGQRAKYLERVKKAQAKREELLALIPRLTLVLPPGSSPDVRITRNGETFTSTSLGVELPVDPGEHVITVQVGRGALREQRMTIGRGEKQTVVLELPNVEPPEPAPIMPYEPTPLPVRLPDPPQGLRTAGLVVGGVGVAGVVTGVVAGVMVFRAKPVITANCPENRCNAEGLAAVNGLPTLDAVNAVGLALGGVGVVSGAVMLALGSGAKLEKGRKVGLSVSGFVDGSKDAMIGVKGAF